MTKRCNPYEGPFPVTTTNEERGKNVVRTAPYQHRGLITTTHYHSSAFAAARK